MIIVEKKSRGFHDILLGRCGENNILQIRINIQSLIDTYGDGNAILVHKRSQDSIPYLVPIERDDNEIVWTVTSVDTNYPGVGECEIRWLVGDAIAKSIIYKTVVRPSLTGETTPEPPDSWYDLMIAYLNEHTVTNVAVNYLPSGSEPTVVYDDGLVTFGIPAGEKGEKGDKGDKGDQGEQGIQGIQGLKGDKGDTGEQGLKGDKGETGATGPKGDKGDQGIQGEKGDKGDQGIQGEKGDKGDTGNGIESIEKTGTSGGVDTYTITMTDGTTYDFTVTNGEDIGAREEITSLKEDLSENVGDLKSALDACAIDVINIRENKSIGFLNSIGAVNESATIYSASPYIPVKAGDVFTYLVKSASGGSIIAHYTDKIDTSMDSNVLSTGAEQKGTYTVPNNGFIRVGWINSFENDLYFYKSDYIPDVVTQVVKKFIADLPDPDVYVYKNVSDVYKKVYAVNTNNLQNGFINGSGDFSANEIYRSTDFLPINNGESFTYKLSHGTALPIIAFYDTDKVYDSTKSIVGIPGYSTGSYTATADGFIRFTYLASRDDIGVFFTSEIPNNIKKFINEYNPTNEVPQMNILCLGDSIFGEDDDITKALSTLSGATVINGAVGGTRATDRGGGNGFRDFDGVNLIEALCTNTWTDQDAGADAIKDTYTWITDKLALLKSVDMSEIDLITFNWGTNDYVASVSMADIVSAHNTVIDTIQTYYPAIRIVVVSPIWRYFGTIADNTNTDNYAYNVNTLKEISNAIVQNAQDKRISVLDAYKNMPLNYKTASLYFNSGSDVHLNTVGGKLFAHYLNGFINSIC